MDYFLFRGRWGVEIYLIVLNVVEIRMFLSFCVVELLKDDYDISICIFKVFVNYIVKIV